MIALYARQSIDRPDSISIESQLDFCRREIGDAPHRVFTDRGFSGKSTDRPAFQELLAAIERGEISAVVVYKLDRISRSILDFSNMIELFGRHDVQFVSSTEKFDTGTPMGRAMLHICIVFAQLERETIQKRVTDAYYSRSSKGLYMGGRVPYGYRLAETELGGVRTARYLPEPEEAPQVKLLYSWYARPQTSCGDLIRLLREQGACNRRGESWNRSRLADLLKNPVYVRADAEVYAFFRQAGTLIQNPPEDFCGINGCYLYGSADTPRKTVSLAGQRLVLAPHEGLVDADIWLRARRKCMPANPAAKPLKAKNTWLAGKIKCARCGFALTIRKANTSAGRYFICSRRMQAGDCDGAGTLYAHEVEAAVSDAICAKLAAFSAAVPPPARESPEAARLRARLRQLDNELSALLDHLPQAGAALARQIDRRATELEEQRAQTLAVLSGISVPAAPPPDYAAQFPALSFEGKRLAADALIETVYACAEQISIVWRV